MEAIISPLLFSAFAFIFLLLFQLGTANGIGGSHINKTEVKGITIVGAILDSSSRIGKEEKVAMDMAIEDFQSLVTNQSITLRVKNSGGEPIQAARAASHLINKKHVQAILGPTTWEEASLVADIGSHSHIPVLSLADSTPEWATMRWPFLIQASPQTQRAQTKAVAAMVQSYGWRRVVVIYEDTDSAATGVISHLHDSLLDVGAEISTLVGLPPFISNSSFLVEELEKVKTGQCRVVVVHTSLPVALRLFDQAKKMGMMEQGYVWIASDTIASLVHAINSSAISSMQGVVGIRSYFNDSGQSYNDFYARFVKKFSTENPEERNHEPGVFALLAYDATRAVTLAIRKSNTKGRDLFDQILTSDFDGLTGEFQFIQRKLAPTRAFQIINVIGKSYKEIGFWYDGLGFSRNIMERETRYKNSMEGMGQVVWPGEPRSTPKGWTLPTTGGGGSGSLRVAVPNGTLFNVYLTVDYDPVANNYTFGGFSIEVFKSTVAQMQYALPFDFFLFDGTFDDMLDHVYNKKFDAAIGPIAITAERYKHIEFSQPHTDTALMMVVPVQSQMGDKAWMFLKPFTKAMWVLTALINVYNGFVIWMIEREHSLHLRGSTLNQIGTLLWLAFATLFSPSGEKLHSNLSRMASVVWLFVALVIIQSYTANLTSMLTVSRVVPTVADIETLKYNNAKVGSYKRAFVSNYLTDVLHFDRNNMRNYTHPEEIAKALRNKEIAAAFLESPVAKLFLARYCKSFITAGPTFKIGGYGFAFQKGSLIVPDINEALLEVIDSGKLLELEKNVMDTESCTDVDSGYDNVSLSPSSFCVLFVLTGGTSTIALVVYVFLRRRRFEDSVHRNVTIWVVMLGMMKSWSVPMNRFSKKVNHAPETPRTGSPPDMPEAPWNPV